jgi:ubiquinone/menaquinone biosynthesis C-methylase UbiE
MNLLDIVKRGVPRPWTEGDNIPWSDPDFSKRMLKEHLSQEHDAASRRSSMIDQHVRFIHERLLYAKPARVLDLGCGPGLYALRLARQGSSVRGIDFSPASIEYARQAAQAEGLPVQFDLGDVRETEYGQDEYDLVMFIYGEMNVFSPKHIRHILRKALLALKPGGKLLLEPSTEESVVRLGKERPAWSAQTQGLFSDRPHLSLFEAYWDNEQRAAIHRHITIDAETAEVTWSTANYQSYRDTEMRELLEECGFIHVKFYPSLTGEDDSSDFYAVVGEKGSRTS